MSDVTLRCSKCGRQAVVSEFVDPESLRCAGCGERLPFVRRNTARISPTLLRHASSAEETQPQEQPEQTQVRRKRRGRRKRRTFTLRFARFHLSEYALSWIVFLVLTPIFLRLRFGGVFTNEASLNTCKIYGMIGIGLIYLVVVLDAFRDEMFQGLLSLFIPPYTLYFLFFRSDSFGLRALIGAFTAGFGYDAYILLSGYAIEFMRVGLDFVRQGGDYNPM